MYDPADKIEDTPRDKLHRLEDMLPELPEMVGRAQAALNEALYTMSEANSELTVDYDTALLIWMTVEWARKATPEQIADIKL